MMKKWKKNAALSLAADKMKNEGTNARLLWAATHKAGELFQAYGTTANGLSPEAVELSREEHGENVLTYGKKEPLLRRLAEAFINPFTVVLLALAVISLFTDVLLAQPGEENIATVLIITGMVGISGVLRFVQETRSGNVAAKLSGMLHTTALVERDNVRAELPMEELVAGDIVHLSAGDMVPADVRILQAKDLFLSQSALTGESEPVEKTGAVALGKSSLTELPNLAFLGSSVVSGSAKALVLSVGNRTMLGVLAKS